MAGFKKFLDILNLFSEVQSNWTVQQISARLEVPSSTIYRSVRELVATRFLEPSIDGHYRLGSSFVEFDRRVRITDPLVREGSAFLVDLVEQAQISSVAVLARLYGDQVMCVSDQQSRMSRVRTSYERGLPRPLTRGATSKAILAQLPQRKLTKLLQSEDWSVERRGSSANDEREFADEIAAVRKRGYAIGRGEVDDGLVGIAAPVWVPEIAIMGSISLIVSAEDLDDAAERRLIFLVLSSAKLLSEKLRSEHATVEHSVQAF